MNESGVKRIMIVDDEDNILVGLSCVLRTDGVEVVACNEIEQAERALEKIHFDLVIADIRMSGVSGIDGLELLSYIGQHYETKVIIMTGHGSDEIEVDAYRRGAHHFFNKPVDVVELLHQVSRLGIPVKKFP
jgi:DNA-binding NtrC family response regulator